MKKRVFVALLAVLMFTTVLVSCTGESSETTVGSKQESQSKDDQSSDGTDDNSEVVNNTNLEGLPIVVEPITLVVAANARSASYQAPWDELEWIHELQRVSGITFEFNIPQSNEEKNVMFATGDYPDIMFNGPSDKQILDASLGGDLYALDEYIPTYAPNWDTYLKENEYARKVVTSSEGKIWSLPIVRDEPSNSGLRDQWLINKVWLDELNLDVPTTVDEFRHVLSEFKANAGNGSIPENAIPYYQYGVINNVGGALDFIASFGIPVANERGLVVLDDNGKVTFPFANESIKEPLTVMHEFYSEGLISAEGLTDDWDTYLTKTRSEPAMVGSYHSYQNPDATNTSVVAMGPLDAENGKKPLARIQTNHVLRNHFTVFKNCEYPEAAVRLANLIAEEDWSIQAMYGMFGDEYIQKNDDGTIMMHPYPADAQGVNVPMNAISFLLPRELWDRFEYAEGSAQRQRADAISEVYSPYSMKLENLYPNVQFEEEQTLRIAELRTDIDDFTRSTVANWMLNGGIDAEWDDYVSQLNTLGLDEYLSILQDALDAFNAN